MGTVRTFNGFDIDNLPAIDAAGYSTDDSYILKTLNYTIIFNGYATNTGSIAVVTKETSFDHLENKLYEITGFSETYPSFVSQRLKIDPRFGSFAAYITPEEFLQFLFPNGYSVSQSGSNAT